LAGDLIRLLHNAGPALSADLRLPTSDLRGDSSPLASTPRTCSPCADLI